MYYFDLWYNFFINLLYVLMENLIGIYKWIFVIDEIFYDKKIILCFCGVDLVYYVWVNGYEVGYSKGV